MFDTDESDEMGSDSSSSYSESEWKPKKDKRSVSGSRSRIHRSLPKILENSSLNYAAWTGDVEEMLRLLETGQTPNKKDDLYGATTLHFAAMGQNVESLRVLLLRGDCNANTLSEEGYSPLMYAAEQGSLQCLHELLLQPNLCVDQKGKCGETALTLACDRVLAGSKFHDYDEASVLEMEQIQMCALLLQHKAEFDVRDGNGLLILHKAARSQAILAPKLIALLMEAYRNNPKYERNEGLQRNQSYIETEDMWNGYTALMYAAKCGSLQSLNQLLEEERICVDHKCKKGQTAFLLAADRLLRDENSDFVDPREDPCPEDEVFEICKSLFHFGADVNIRNENGELLLHKACGAYIAEEYTPKLIDLILLKTKYDAEAEKKVKLSPLQLALRGYCDGNVYVLLKYTNQTDFVRPNREFLLEDCSRKSTNLGRHKVISNICLVVKGIEPYAGNILQQMIDQGWNINGEDRVMSPLAAFGKSLSYRAYVSYKMHDDYDNVEECMADLMPVFARNMAKMRLSEAKDVFLDLCFDRHSSVLIKESFRWGLVIPEVVLRVDVTELTKHCDFSFLMGLVAIVHIINVNFGCQGRYHAFIKSALNALKDIPYQDDPDDWWKRTFNVVKVNASAMARRLPKMGNLQTFARTVIRRNLIANNFLHPWEMKVALEDFLPIPALVDYVTSTEISWWPPLDSDWYKRRSNNY